MSRLQTRFAELKEQNRAALGNLTPHSMQNLVWGGAAGEVAALKARSSASGAYTSTIGVAAPWATSRAWNHAFPAMTSVTCSNAGCSPSQSAHTLSAKSLTTLALT